MSEGKRDLSWQGLIEQEKVRGVIDGGAYSWLFAPFLKLSFEHILRDT